MTDTQPAAAPATTTPAKRGMKLHWITMVIIVGSLVLHVMTPNAPGKSGAYESGYKFGQWVGGLLVAWILGAIGYYCARRSSVVLNIVLCLVMSIRLVGDGLMLWRGGDRSAMAKIEAKASEVAKAQREANERGDTDAALKASDALVSEMRENASSMSPKQRAIVEVNAGFVEQMSIKGRLFKEAVEGWQAAGGLSGAGLTEAGLEQRLAALTTAQQRAQEMSSFVNSIGAEMIGEFKRRGVSQEDAETNTSAFLRGARIGTLTRYCEANAKFFDAAMACTKHLKASRWTVEGEQVLFEKDEDRVKYNELADACDKASAEVDRLRESMMGK